HRPRRGGTMRFAAVVIFVAACGGVDTSDNTAPCGPNPPCAKGFVCDSASFTCRSTMTVAADAGPPDARLPDAAPPPPRLLTIAPAGTGAGPVASSPAGIACGAGCSAPFPDGTSVILPAVPAATSTFAGWDGAGCSGTG